MRYKENEQISYEAIIVAIKLTDIQKTFFDEVRYVDDTAQIVLKGHLVVEDLMNKALESFMLHGEHIEDARLQFHQKLEICKSISLSDNKNNMWNLIMKIYVLRNALSHSLDKDRRERAILLLKSIYDQEFDPQSRYIDDMSEEAAPCIAAIGGALGYLSSFLSEVQRFKSIIKDLDKIINNGELSRGA